MRFSALSTALLCICGSTAVPLTSRQSDKIKGVNIGGWLLLEPWITPSLFANGEIDEWSLSSSNPGGIKSHWASFIQQSDFQAIKNAGFNTVRIPIGYWAFQKVDGDPYIQGQDEYLEAAVGWCNQIGLKVWIDLHGAPGSQNMFDNSGRRDTLKWQTGNNVETTLDIIEQIAKKYANSVDGIELLNEPQGGLLDVEKVRQFSRDAFGRVKAVSGSPKVVIHDAFQNPNTWNEFSGQNSNVWIDHHHYQIFTNGQISQSFQNQINGACSAHFETDGTTTAGLVVGEWSAALTDCAKYLNGVGRGARYEGQFDGSGFIGQCAPWQQDYSQWTQEMRSNVATYIAAQIQTFERYGNGWIFWTWKTENAPEWDAKRLLAAGIFPSDLTGKGPCG